MLAILPAIFFVLAATYFAGSRELRVAFMHGAIVTGLAVVANTEILSLFGGLSRAPLAVTWSVECTLAAVGVWMKRAELAALSNRLKPGKDDRLVILAVIPIVVIAAAVAVIAIVAPPNTFDSMTYHMARVAHWNADGTVAFYPTNIVRQLYSPPWGEYGIAQLQILSGGDRGANLVQWFCMVGSVVVTSLIARQLGAPRWGQVLAAIATATLPMGILQASSTQTDYAAAFWLACAIATALMFVAAPARHSALWVGSCIGLAALSKGTGYLYAVPLIALLAGWMLWRRPRGWVASAAVMVAVPVLINSGMWIRNEVVFHNPLAPGDETASLASSTHSPSAIVSSVLRDAVLQVGTPSTSLNRRLDSAVRRIHTQLLHIDVNDPRTTWGSATFAVNPLSLDEDYAGDPLQAIAALAAIVLVLLPPRRAVMPVLYAAGLAVGFIFFAAYLKWQPWNSRLELPVMVAACPLIGAALGRGMRPLVPALIAGALVLGAVPFVIDNQTRPMVGFGFSFSPRALPEGETIFNAPRTDLYFVKYSTLEDPYLQVAAEARRLGCREVGLWAGGNDWEYPLWVVTQADGVRFDHVRVTNASASTGTAGGHPCMVVGTILKHAESVTVGGETFTLMYIDGGVYVYELLHS